MRSEEIIRAWVESKRDAEIGGDVADLVMGRIYDYEEKKGEPLTISMRSKGRKNGVNRMDCSILG